MTEAARRQRLRFILWFVLAAGLAVGTAAGAGAPDLPAVVAQVQQRLVDAPVLRGRFEQRKTLKGFRNPLVSRGDFVVARGRGVIWQTRSPFESTLVLTRERLLSRQADGSVSGRVDASQEPGLRVVNSMLFALLSADLAALAKRFDIDGQLQGTSAWRLTLRPREPALLQWLARIELEGDQHVRVVRMEEASGDRSQISFSDLVTAAALSAQESARLE